MPLTIFAIIAIFTSCLGLFGLITYIAETKTKEIGIRRTPGATIMDVISMLSKEFPVLAAAAIVIALSLSYYLLTAIIVEAYAYHISLNRRIFGLAALVTLLPTILTVSGKAFKAVRANPVKAIKTE